MSYPHYTGDSVRWGPATWSDGTETPAGGRHCIEWRGEPPEIVTLCGSTRFMDEFIAETRRLTLEGKLVISVGMFGHQEPDLDIGTAEAPTEVKMDLDELHKRKIDLCDAIYVICPAGYIGSSTESEIAYAIKHGKSVRYSEELPTSFTNQ